MPSSSEAHSILGAEDTERQSQPLCAQDPVYGARLRWVRRELPRGQGRQHRKLTKGPGRRELVGKKMKGIASRVQHEPGHEGACSGAGLSGQSAT